MDFSGSHDKVFKLKEHCKKYKTISEYSYGEDISPEDFFSIECDIVIPAAKELVICGDDGKKLNCKLIVEAANGPIDLEAEKNILSNNIDIIPDVMANSGGVVVSYYEWLQNKRSEYWDKHTVLEKLANKMKETFNNVYNKHINENISMRVACYILAIHKIEQIIKKKRIF